MQHVRQPARLRQIEKAVRAALIGMPGDARHHYALGQILVRLGKLPEALACFEKAAALRPDWARAHTRAGEMLGRLGQLHEARRALEQAVRVKPGYARAWRQLGNLGAFQGRYAEATAAYRRAVVIEPCDAVTHILLGTSLQNGGDFQSAVRCYRRAIDLDPDLADAHSNLATALQGLGRLHEAAEQFRAALNLAPGHSHALAGLASILELETRYNEALELIADHVHVESTDIELVATFARLKNRLGENREAIGILDRVMKRGFLSTAQKRRIHFVLGDCHDAVGEFDKAFSHYQAGNRLKPGTFDPAQHEAQIGMLIETFSTPNMKPLAGRGNRTRKPVFIVGMPRSGSSLVEQILAAHPDIYSCGERDDIARLVLSLGQQARSLGGYPRCVGEMAPAQLEAAAGAYLARTRAMEGRALRITDKSPGNFLHLGLVELMFPQSRVLHCMRDPLDTGLSCYFQDFAGRAVPFAQNLEHIGIYYREYQRIMSHWRNVLSLPIMDIRYEELVSEPEQVARRMIEFLGLEWDDRCLRHHEVQRVVLTASSAQARRPIYRSSVRRHVNYQSYLEPLIRSLGSTVQAAP